MKLAFGGWEWLNSSEPLLSGSGTWSQSRHPTGVGSTFGGSWSVEYDPRAGYSIGNPLFEAYRRFYFCPLRLATNGAETKLWGCLGSREGTHPLIVTFTPAGTLTVTNWGNCSPVRMGESAVLTLGRWYMVEVRAKFNTAFSAPLNGFAQWRIDGIEQVISPAPTNGCGLNLTGAFIQGTYRDVFGGGNSPFTGNALYQLDDWAIDTSEWPGESRVKVIPAAGQGTRNGWSATADSWKMLADSVVSFSDVSSGSALSSSTPGDAVTVRVQSPQEAGLAGTIPATPEGTVRLNWGTYVGTGVPQEIDVGFHPDFVYVIGQASSGTSQFGYMTWTGYPGAIRLDTVSQASGTLPTTTPRGFIVLGTTDGTLNKAGLTYWWIAMSDPSGRYMETGQMNMPSGDDNVTAAFRRTDFTPEMLFLHRLGGSFGQAFSMKGPGHVGELSTLISATPTGDQNDRIQAMGTGSVTVGTLVSSGTGSTNAYLGLRTTGVHTERLIDISSYVGDNTTNRTITVNLTEPLVAVFVMPSSNEARMLKHSLHASNAAQDMVNGLLSTSSSGFTGVLGSASFVVGNGSLGGQFLNKSGVVYHVLAFAAGTDIGDVPSYQRVQLSASSAAMVYAGVLGGSGGNVTFLLWKNGVEYTSLPVSITASLPVVYGALFPREIVGAFSATDQLEVGVRLESGGPMQVTTLGMGLEFNLTMPEIESGDLIWAEITDHANGVHPVSTMALTDPATYYGGYKEPRVIDWGTIRRSLSDEQGVMEWSDFSFLMSDTDHFWRTLLSNLSTRALLNMPVVVRTISDALRRVFGVPRTIARGLIGNYALPAPMKAELTLKDPIGLRFSSSKEADQIPKRIVTKADFPNCDVDLVASSAVNYRLSASAATDATELDVIGDGGRFWPGAAFTFGPSTGGAGTPTNPIGAMVDLYGAGSNWNALRPAFGGPVNDVTTAMGAAYGTTSNWNALRPTDGTGGGGAGTTYETTVYTISDTGGDPGWPASTTTHIKISPKLASAKPSGAVLIEKPAFKVETSLGKPVPIVYGIISDTNTPGSDEGDGQGPALYVGDRTIGSTVWREFLWAGHACAGLFGGSPFLEAYVGHSPIPITSGDVLVPGTAAWNAAGLGPNTYRDYNGNRYTVLYLKGASGDRAIGIATGTVDWVAHVFAIDGAGCALNADGTGGVIQDLPLQYRHCLQNWIYGDYKSGAWLGSATYPDTEGVPMIDDASFDTVNAKAKRRVPGGYPGNFVIGWTCLDSGMSRVGGDRITARDLIGRFNINCDCNSGNNRKTQFIVSMIDDDTPPLIANTVRLTDNEFLKDSFGLIPRPDDLFNVVPYRHTEDYIRREKEGWRSVEAGVNEVRDALSIADYGELVSPIRQFHMLRGYNRSGDYAPYQQGSLAVNDIVRRYLMRHKAMPYYVQCAVDHTGTTIELGDYLYVTAGGGLGASGYVKQPMRVIRHEMDPDTLRCDLVLFDMGVLFEGGFILGPDSIGATWPVASAADRRYGYLAPDSGVFSDGAHAKVLR